MSKFRLVIGDFLPVHVKGSILGAEKPVNFDFKLTMRRLAASEISDRMNSDDKASLADFLVTNATGWSGQTLIVDESGQPAEFGEDALRALLDVAGMAGKVLGCYFEALQISDTAKGRAGN